MTEYKKSNHDITMVIYVTMETWYTRIVTVQFGPVCSYNDIVKACSH